MKDKSEPEPEEYKIIYSLEDSAELLTKYFMATDHEGAKEMFPLFAKKRFYCVC